MNRVTFGSHEVLIGLDWDVPSDNRGSEGSMVRAMLRSESHRGCRYGTVVRSTDSTGSSTITVGFVPATEKLRPKQPAAAALLGLASQARRLSGPLDSGLSTTENVTWNWLVIEKINEDMYWLAGIMQGAPLPTSDFVGSFDQVVEVANEFLRSGENDFIVHSPDQDARNALAMVAESVSDQGFVSLVDNTEGLRFQDAIPKQLAGLRLPMLILLVGMVVLIVGTVSVIHWRNQRALDAARSRQAAASAAQARQDARDREDYRQKVQSAIQDALVQGKKGIDAALASPSPVSLIQAWVDALATLDTDQAGWQIASVGCSSGERPRCNVSLTRGDKGVNRLLLEAHPDAVIDGDKASYDLQGAAVTNRSANWDHLVDARAMQVGLISDLQLLRNGGLEYHQDATKEIVQPVTVPPSPLDKFRPGSTEKVGPPPTVQMGVASGGLGVGGHALWQLTGTSEFLDQAGVTLQSVAFTVSAGMVTDWKLTGLYYVRSKPQPILPTIMVDGKPLPMEMPKAFQQTYQAVGGMSASQGLAPTPASSSSATGPALPGGLPPPPPPPPLPMPVGAPAPVMVPPSPSVAPPAPTQF